METLLLSLLLLTPLLMLLLQRYQERRLKQLESELGEMLWRLEGLGVKVERVEARTRMHLPSVVTQPVPRYPVTHPLPGARLRLVTSTSAPDTGDPPPPLAS